MSLSLKSLNLLIFTMVFVQVVPGQQIPPMPLSYPFENTLEYEWAQKPVLETMNLSGMETMENWEHSGFGTLTLSEEMVYSGDHSLLITSPTRGDRPTRGRPWGVSSALFRVDSADWSDWNRITFRVYPDLPGFKLVSLSLVFHNAGEEQVPDSYERNGLNYQMLNNQQWNQVYWEIGHLGRDRVTGVEIRYRTQGNEPGAATIVNYYLDELCLEKVEPDHYEGWNVAPGLLASNHTGYATGYPKTALTSDTRSRKFKLIDASTGKTVLEKKILRKDSRIGSFNILDFSEYNERGSYFIQTGDIRSQAFMIDTFDKVFRSSVIKTINHFYSQRCGYAVPGVHDVCHRDWTGNYGDLSVVINGGWHDAGDLSQGLGNTSDATHAMFDLAYRIRWSDPDLSARLIEEASWGLDWMLKTRFPDGARFGFSTMDFYTDGIIGTVDDVPGEARFSAQANIHCARTEAMAYLALAHTDFFLANRALETAEADWMSAMGNFRRMNVELAGNIVNASLSLYRATGKTIYRDSAIAYGDTILACQQTEDLDEDLSLKGFFYRNSEKREILHYSHQSYEQEPVLALVSLCQTFPEHANLDKWDASIRLYADFYLQIVTYTDPWYMIPAGIYDLSSARSETDREQISNGFRLNERYYLKCFPCWSTFRGNSGTTLSQAKGLVAAANYLENERLRDIGYKALEWHLGFNPFCQSLMYGEGYRYAGQYSTMSGNLVGGLPVGVQTHFNRDLPYWPAENCYNWKEIWVFPSARWLWIMSSLY